MKINLTLLSTLAVASAALAPLPSAFAQHGSTTPAEPLPVLAAAPQVSVAPDAKAEPAVTVFLKDFAEALRTHQGKPFLPRLAEHYTIEGYNGPDMKAGFVLALTMIAAPLEIVVTGIEPAESGGKLVKTDFKYAKRSVARTFTLDAGGKLVRTTLIAMPRPAGAESSTPIHH